MSGRDLEEVGAWYFLVYFLVDVSLSPTLKGGRSLRAHQGWKAQAAIGMLLFRGCLNLRV